MKYVQRDGAGNVVGVYGCPQPQEDGTSLTDTQPLEDEHPEVAAFNAAQDARLSVKNQQRQDLEAKVSSLPDGQRQIFDSLLKLIPR